MEQPRLRWGLRLRVALALALACLLVVGALGITLFAASEEMEEALITQLVTEEMDYVLKRHRQDPGYAPQPSSNLQAYVVRNAREQELLPAFLVGLGPGQHEFFVGNEEYHVLVREANGVRYVVAYEVGLHEQREREFKLLIVLAVLTAVAASLVLGYWLSGILVSQVTELAAQVGRLSPGRRRVGLSRPEQDPEVAMLARALDGYQGNIERMIRREQEFTANASHELRTPLTTIRTSCELLLADAALAEKARARVAMINDAAARMTEQIQMLLLLARGQSLGEAESVDVADCVAEAAEPYRGEIARKGLAFESAVARDAVVEANYQALRLVLSNLIRNAVQYTERGSVRIDFDARRLRVSDTGRGISNDHLPRVFERHFRGDAMNEGAGIGLAIVERICEQHGWRIEVESAPLKGTTFSLVFP
ncbi:MAG: two-component sensor histidine kinase [Betaproteobacteria bacterium RIFCSPLOWO2_02_FULL_67_26]|nr:MAG: two-component sensor histidine kinase [Betaproteobacteria bacterium RIFCSPLOWO2_02_FULL_67_26]